MSSELQVLEETIYRMRRLHGVLDCALGLAAAALHENVGGGLLVSEWHERLIQEATKKLKDEGVFDGRWILFTDDELGAMAEVVPGLLGDEIRGEIERRLTVPDPV